MTTQPKNEFTCPVCGSHFYGTTFPNIPGVDLRSPIEHLIGYCKGALITHDRTTGRPVHKGGYTGCSFKWSRRDDVKYGLVNYGAKR